MLVGDVVGEFQLVEGDDLLHPLLAGRGAVRMDVHPLWHFRIRFTRYHPSAAEKKKEDAGFKYGCKQLILGNCTALISQ